MKTAAILMALAMVFSASAQCDKQATPEVRKLFSYLKGVSGKNILFGQQYPVLCCQGKEDEQKGNGLCDFLTSAGAYPALWGCNLEKKNEANRTQMILAYQHHAINTVHWEMSNPVTGGDNSDLKGDPVAKILPGGALHQSFCQSLDELAELFASLKDAHGRPIPVLFRPFHENTGTMFWWGAKNCTPDQYKALFRFTVEYLRDKRAVHHLLMVYAPARPSETENYLLRYPGDDMVDIIAFDHYCTKANFAKAIVADCRIVVNLANTRGKISAIAETGFKKGIQNSSNRNWFTQELLGPILRDPIARKVSYIMTWKNSAKNYWVPLRGQPAFEDFVKMIHNPAIMLADRLPPDLFGTMAKP